MLVLGTNVSAGRLCTYCRRPVCCKATTDNVRDDDGDHPIVSHAQPTPYAAHKNAQPTQRNTPKRIVVALGGNALLQRGQPLTIDAQVSNARTAAHAIATLVAQGENVSLCITHGNGPQVGLLAEQDPSTPLDVLGAESEGQIGYLVELELQSVLPHQFCAILTKTVVDPTDPAFANPTKYIGPMYSEQEAQRCVEGTVYHGCGVQPAMCHTITIIMWRV